MTIKICSFTFLVDANFFGFFFYFEASFPPLREITKNDVKHKIWNVVVVVFLVLHLCFQG